MPSTRLRARSLRAPPGDRPRAAGTAASAYFLRRRAPGRAAGPLPRSDIAPDTLVSRKSLRHAPFCLTELPTETLLSSGRTSNSPSPSGFNAECCSRRGDVTTLSRSLSDPSGPAAAPGAREFSRRRACRNARGQRNRSFLVLARTPGTSSGIRSPLAVYCRALVSLPTSTFASANGR